LDGDKKAEVTRQMERDREQLIGPLVDRKLYEEAASLAEKYLDFDSLGTVPIISESDRVVGNRIRGNQFLICYSILKYTGTFP
jgi:hypothetical protein